MNIFITFDNKASTFRKSELGHICKSPVDCILDDSHNQHGMYNVFKIEIYISIFLYVCKFSPVTAGAKISAWDLLCYSFWAPVH